MLTAMGDHCSAEQSAIGGIGIDAQHTIGSAKDACAAVFVTTRRANDDALFGEGVEAGTHRDDIRIGEGDTQRDFAPESGRGFARSVLARNCALIGRFMHQRGVGVGVTRDIDRQIADLHGQLAEERQAALVEGKSC